MESARAHQWWPGLEGLRGIALVAVLIYHQDHALIPGGFLSVSLFFTLSGFLITTLVLGEHQRSGRLDVTRFWGRRVRRLLPVAMFGLLFAGIVAWITRPAAQLGTVADDIRMAALNLGNWRFVREDTGYLAALADPSPVTHYWSLAIEEQYYLVYPVLAALALRWRRRGLGILLMGLMACSFVAQLLVSGDRAYFGTDTRLAELAIGGLAAVLWTGRARDVLRRWVDPVAGLAAAGVAVLWWRLELSDPRLWEGGLLLHSVLVSLLVIGAVEGGWVTRITSFRPAAWLGGLSYACYVVHFPMFLLLDADRVGLDGVPLFALRVGASILFAVGLRAVLERPVRFSGAFPRWQAPVAAATAMILVIVVATAIPEVGRTGGDDDLLVLDQDGPALVQDEVPDVVALPPVIGDGTTTSTDPAAPTTTTPGDPRTAAPGTSATTATTGRPGGGRTTSTTAPQEQPRALKLLVAGDSTAGEWGRGMQQWAERNGYASVDLDGGPGCVIHPEGDALMRLNWTYEVGAACSALMDLVVRDVQTVRPDAVVIVIGSVQLADWNGVNPLGAGFGDPGFDGRYRAAFDRALDRLDAIGIPVLVATIGGPRWEPQGAPGTGELTMNSAVRAQRLNQINALVVSEHPNARMVPFAEKVVDGGFRLRPDLHPDGLHISPSVVPGILDGGLAENLRKAYRAVVNLDPSLRRPGATIWWP